MKRLAALLLLAAVAMPAAQAEIIGIQAERIATEAQMKASLRDIELVDEKGAPLDLRKLMANGKPTLITLWAHWCSNCRAEVPGYNKIAATCGDRWNVVFVSSQPEDFPKDLAKFKTLGLPWSIYHVAASMRSDPAKAMTARAFYGLTTEGGVITPLHYFVDRNGAVDAIVNGRMDFDEPDRLAVFCAS